MMKNLYPDIVRNKVVVFDLDDTLYKEIDFLKSAFTEIAEVVSVNKKMNKTVVFSSMLSSYYDKKNVFQELITKYELDDTIQNLLNVYRNHKPTINPSTNAINLLEAIKNLGIPLGIITDGRSIQQRNKIRALGITSYFQNILISEEFGSEKPDSRNFQFYMDSYKHYQYYYIGDNTAKDFIAPNNLGWTTICLLDNGRNIHKQDFNLDTSNLPHYTIYDLIELLQFIS